jgi:Fe2+ or Zn2+ uptake regulation protein
MNLGLQSLVSDIAIAMFKVASVIRHETLKSELEKLSVYIASDPSEDNIFKAENIISLGREVGEIRPINAVVLIRELENLRKAISTPSSEEKDVDITTQFVKNNTDKSSTVSASSSVIPLKKGIQFSNSDNKEFHNKDTYTKNTATKKTSNKSGRRSSLNPDKVYQYIADHKEAKLKDLQAEFKSVSGRTVRRITNSLIERGDIERVGNPGPTSFYKVASKENNSSHYIQETKKEENSEPPVAPAPSSNIPSPSSTAPDSSVIPAPRPSVASGEGGKARIQSDSVKSIDYSQNKQTHSYSEPPSVIAL